MMPKRVFTREHKREVWKLASRGGESKTQLERELGLTARQISI